MRNLGQRAGTTLILLLAMMWSTGAYGHGDKVHVHGTLVSVSAESITVKQADGKPVDVKLVKATVYLLHANNTDQPATAGDLAVGDMVVIHATSTPGGLAADEVKFSVPAKTAPK
jgi:ABC-type Fe3+-hydroxamate transport system substrate-binding protein